MKRTIALVVCLLMSLILLPAIGTSEGGSLVLPSSLRTVEQEAFYQDSSLRSVIIQEGTDAINTRAFANSGVWEIVLPGSLSYISSDAFSGCNLSYVYAPLNSYAYKWAAKLDCKLLEYKTGTVKAVAVGPETSKLAYAVVDKKVIYWRDTADSIRVFAFVAIKNTGSKYIYMDSCTFDYEDSSGHLIDSESWISSHPNVITPGSVGYFYASGVNGGYLGDNVDTSNGVNLVAQFSLEESDEKIRAYKVFDTSIAFENTLASETPVILGKVTNNTNEDDSLCYVVGVLKDKAGKVVCIDGTNITKLYAGSTVGFKLTMYSLPPGVAKGTIGSYEIIATPSYYQYH